MTIDLAPERRRRWSPEQRLAMDRESLEPEQIVSLVVRRRAAMPTSCSCGPS
ncbi:hypothetical protein EQV97_24170 [Pseudomonas sp. TMW22090]|nr:hypothetical protein [Pseudomonas sp. TMW22090]